ncbi:MAG: single-stranded-DNA-specific exonuclease RecJ [Flavobacteriales bacterium]
MEYAWIVSDNACPQKVAKLVKEVKISPLIAQLLVRRGIETYAEAERFFRPKWEHVNDPFLFKNMKDAVRILQAAVKENKRILLFGDYDVDGTSAVAICHNVLSKHTQNVDYYIPDRYEEGYGISEKGITYAIASNVDLFISLDCGIRSCHWIEQLKAHGIEVIVCDHHEPGEHLPNACILDPKVSGETYPFEGLSGAGVAMKLLEALYTTMDGDRNHLLAQMDLLALSIAADIVPVVNENRVYAFMGLNELNRKTRPSFKWMLTKANRKGKIVLSDLVFTLAPRINAAGRIRTGRTAVECMLDAPVEGVEALVDAIEQDNTARRLLDASITQEALEALQKAPKERSSNVLYSKDWHKGVVGIVASRIIESHPLPTIILTEVDGVLTGSARTVGDFNLHQALVKLDAYLIQYGGHQHAAGLSLKKDRFESFKKAFDDLAKQYFESHSKEQPLRIESKITFQSLFGTEPPQGIPKLMRILDSFEPFGPGNMKPVFLSEEVYALESKILKDLHLKVNATQPNVGITINGIGFNLGEKEPLVTPGVAFDLAYTLEINEFNSQRKLQLNIKDIREHNVIV